MNTIFLKLLNMSITAGWLIMAVTALRLFVKKAPKWITCALWALVAVRLCCPFAAESSFSLIPQAETIHLTDNPYSPNSMYDNKISSYMDRSLTESTLTDNTLTGSSFTDNSLTDSPPANNATAAAYSTNPLHALLPIASSIWMIGLCVMLSYALYSFLRIHHNVQEAALMQDRIWLCDTVHSPFILGLIRPRIYLPSDLDQTQLPYVLAHEQAHLKRHDHWWKFLGYLLLAVYWFHPLVWLAYILFCRDLELACDEKVIRDMDITGKKAYSSALVSCSMPRQVMTVSPLAFGEIGVKERVKMILNYKKPAFRIVITAAITCIVIAVCFLTNPRTDVFDVKIVVPAGSMQHFHYSDMEISPTKNQIILSSGDGLGDTEVVLKTVEVTEETAYEPTYMTPGLAVKMDAEKGAWFKIGAAICNPTDEDITVYVHAENVNVRISAKPVDADDPDAAGESSEIQYNQHPLVQVNNQYYYDTGRESTRSNRSIEMDGRITSEAERREVPLKSDTTLTAKTTNDAHSALSAAITDAILSHNTSPDNTGFTCCDFIMLENVRSINTITCYGWALCQNYRISEKGIEDLGGSHMPVILTFQSGEIEHQLTKYWQPRDGSFYMSDVREHFPAHIAEDALDSQKYIVQQIQSCYRQAVESSGLDTEPVIENLLDTICSNPKASSNPQDYIDANSIEYRELIYYGEYTLRYCLNRFADGNETGLESRIMSMVCETLLQTKGQIPSDADTAATGQLWYDTLLAHGSNKVIPYLNARNAERLVASPQDSTAPDSE